MTLEHIKTCSILLTDKNKLKFIKILYLSLFFWPFWQAKLRNILAGKDVHKKVLSYFLVKVQIIITSMKGNLAGAIKPNTYWLGNLTCEKVGNSYVCLRPVCTAFHCSIAFNNSNWKYPNVQHY